MTPENELLILSAGVSGNFLEAVRSERLRLEEIRWEILLEKAHRHEILPLLYWSLNLLSAEKIPDVFSIRLLEYFTHNSHRNLCLGAELLRMIRLLDEEGITAIPFKGPLLAEFLYGNVALREFCDLDILVRPKDKEKAHDLLLNNGYRDRYASTPAQIRASLKHQCHYAMVDTSDPGKVVELHWDITAGPFFIPMDYSSLWDRAQKFPVAGMEIWMLSPEDQLLLLCIHGGKHHWEKLKWLADIARILQKWPNLDWDQVLDGARIQGSERLFFLGLYCAREFLQVSLPDTISRRIDGDLMVPRLASRIRKRIFQEEARPMGVVEEVLMNVRMRKRFKDKLLYGIRWTAAVCAPTAWEWKQFPLPDRLFFLYYLVRPFRLLGKYTGLVRKERFSATRIGGSAEALWRRTLREH